MENIYGKRERQSEEGLGWKYWKMNGIRGKSKKINGKSEEIISVGERKLNNCNIFEKIMRKYGKIKNI